jgi:hypothetical protein
MSGHPPVKQPYNPSHNLHYRKFLVHRRTTTRSTVTSIVIPWAPKRIENLDIDDGFVGDAERLDWFKRTFLHALVSYEKRISEDQLVQINWWLDLFDAGFPVYRDRPRYSAFMLEHECSFGCIDWNKGYGFSCGYAGDDRVSDDEPGNIDEWDRLIFGDNEGYLALFDKPEESDMDDFDWPHNKYDHPRHKAYGEYSRSATRRDRTTRWDTCRGRKGRIFARKLRRNKLAKSEFQQFYISMRKPEDAVLNVIAPVEYQEYDEDYSDPYYWDTDDDSYYWGDPVIWWGTSTVFEFDWDTPPSIYDYEYWFEDEQPLRQPGSDDLLPAWDDIDHPWFGDPYLFGNPSINEHWLEDDYNDLHGLDTEMAGPEYDAYYDDDFALLMEYDAVWPDDLYGESANWLPPHKLEHVRFVWDARVSRTWQREERSLKWDSCSDRRQRILARKLRRNKLAKSWLQRFYTGMRKLLDTVPDDPMPVAYEEFHEDDFAGINRYYELWFYGNLELEDAYGDPSPCYHDRGDEPVIRWDWTSYIEEKDFPHYDPRSRSGWNIDVDPHAKVEDESEKHDANVDCRHCGEHRIDWHPAAGMCA